jgi:hypothetical protein
MNTIEQTLSLPPASKNRQDSDALIANLQKALELRQNLEEFDQQRTAQIKAQLKILYGQEQSTQNTLETKKSPETLEQATVAIIKNNFDSFFESEPKRDAFLKQIGVKVNSKDSLVLAQNFITHLIDEGVASFEKSNGVAFYTIYTEKINQIPKLKLFFPTIRGLACYRETEAEKQKPYLTHKNYLETQDRPVVISIMEPVSFESEVVEIEPEIKNKADQKKIKVESKYPDNSQKVTSTELGLEVRRTNQNPKIETSKIQNTQEVIQKTAQPGEKSSSELEEDSTQKSSLQRYQGFIKSNLKTISRLKILGSRNIDFIPKIKSKNSTAFEPFSNFTELNNPSAEKVSADLEFRPPQDFTSINSTEISGNLDPVKNFDFWDFTGINFEPPSKPLEEILSTDQKTTVSPFDSIPKPIFEPPTDNYNSGFGAENYKSSLDFTSFDLSSSNSQISKLSENSYKPFKQKSNHQKLEGLKNRIPKPNQNKSEFVLTEIKDFSPKETPTQQPIIQETFESLNNPSVDQKTEANNLVKFARKESLETGKSTQKEVKSEQTETQAANNIVKFVRKEAPIQDSFEANSAKSPEISSDSTSTQSQPVSQASPEMASV